MDETRETDDIERIRDEARRLYADDPAHGWEHALRVETTGVRLAREEDADVRVVRLGALLHDIGRAKEARGEVDDHAAWGAEEARRILDGRVDDEIRDAVVHCVEAHRYSTGPEPRTVEARVVSDADDLDALGAVGVARVLYHSGVSGCSDDSDISDCSDTYNDFDAAAEHAREKLLSLRDGMHTETARRLAEERHAYLAEFFERFDEERQPSTKRSGSS